jgi:hypothetical protein
MRPEPDASLSVGGVAGCVGAEGAMQDANVN